MTWLGQRKQTAGSSVYSLTNSPPLCLCCSAWRSTVAGVCDKDRVEKKIKAYSKKKKKMIEMYNNFSIFREHFYMMDVEKSGTG